MRFRTIALAVALSLGCGAVSAIHAADNTYKRNLKRTKKLNKTRAKQSKASKVKPRKVRKTKRG